MHAKDLDDRKIRHVLTWAHNNQVDIHIVNPQLQENHQRNHKPYCKGRALEIYFYIRRILRGELLVSEPICTQVLFLFWGRWSLENERDHQVPQGR